MTGNTSSSIRSLKGIGEKTEALFNKLNIYSVDDLITYVPRAYYLYSEPVSSYEDVRIGEKQAFFVTVDGKPSIKKGRVSVTILKGIDRNGIRLEMVWFNMPYLRSTIQIGKSYVFFGLVKEISREGKVSLSQPLIFDPEKYEDMMLYPQGIYPLTKGLSNNAVKKAIKAAFEIAGEREDFLPNEILLKRGLPTLSKALYDLHFPEDLEGLRVAKDRLLYDEFLLFLLFEKMSHSRKTVKNTFRLEKRTEFERVMNSLPYPLTEGQKKALSDIMSDLNGPLVTERLIQGDVGSGKTLIAFLSMLLMVENGYKALLMAPTEVLSKQHLITFQKYIEEFSLPYEAVLLNSDVKGSERKETLEKIQSSSGIFIIGTSALITKAREYENVGIVITDEQHRFGVKQRMTLIEKGESPFSLLLSATPIPRTLALILYEGMNITVINDKPKNRLPIKNCLVTREKRRASYSFMAKEIKEGHQCYVICPFVENNDEKPDVCDVMTYKDSLQKEMGSDIRIAFLHGRMSDEEKDRIMRDFYDRKADILVSTTVIEVGIDVPNATVIMIENAERFGLSQLHQLRGRVGRGDAQSYCIFMDCSGKKEPDKKLSVINSSNDGFFIAEEDLKERGPGDLTGIRQSGDEDSGFSYTKLSGNQRLIREASEDADLILKESPDLDLERYSKLSLILSKNEKKLYRNL
ncbi:MAG: ATP-dependent DNA helicase RecG [Lachnospiraceae bacterium]|nr:ATP-dependent DNA helicase RecG [Lachnospiraceae bacterium]